MGLIFLRHAYSRYLSVKDEIEANLPTRERKKRALTKEDFSQRSAIYLQPKAQFDTLVALSDRDDRARAVIGAMESIEADYENLRGVLPKSEYQNWTTACWASSYARSIPMSSNAPPVMSLDASIPDYSRKVLKKGKGIC